MLCRTLEGYSMPAAKFSIKLERKYSYYLLNMVLPVIFLAVLGAFVFLLPVECGEKNGFGLTILLSLSVVMTIVSDNIPPVSSSTCVLSKFFKSVSSRYVDYKKICKLNTLPVYYIY